MPQDYHIYIHSLGGSGGGNGTSKTKPFNARSQEEQESGSIAGAIKEFGNLGNQAEGLISEGISALSEALPMVAIGVAAYQVASKILSVGANHLETYTGNYRFAMGVNNCITSVNNFINPIGLAKKEIHRAFEFDKTNKSIEQTRMLINYSSRIKEGI